MSAILERQRPRPSYTPIRPTPTCVMDPIPPTDPAVLEGYARVLEESGGFKVLRRLPLRPPTPFFRAAGTRMALFVDVETTGPDATADEVIELCVMPFQYAPTGRVIAVHEPVSQLRQPTRPIPTRVTRATGIDAKAVEGRSIDEAALAPLFAEASLVVAHNAAWDRPFLERLSPWFQDLPWACSMTQVAWSAPAGQGLAAIAASMGFFHDAHRAVDDCHAGVEILSVCPLTSRTF